MTADRALRIGVVLEAFLDWPLDRVLPWLREHAPEVTDLEIGAGGYAPHPHCDVAALLASDQARSAWRAGIARHGLRIDALNAWGNPLHPDPDLARQHDQALRAIVVIGEERRVGRVGDHANDLIGQQVDSEADRESIAQRATDGHRRTHAELERERIRDGLPLAADRELRGVAGHPERDGARRAGEREPGRIVEDSREIGGTGRDRPGQ